MDAVVANSMFKTILLSSSLFLFSGCQLTYIVKSAHNQFSMMTTRQSIRHMLQSQDLDPALRKKLELSEKARLFAFEDLRLKKTQNYATYIDLNRPFVTWVASASEKWELKTYEWKYPIVGSMPYKGFFTEVEAKKEVEDLKAQNLDAFYRGVSAYSTLGWFTDSLLSSMIRYSEHDLVDTILHELVHTTLYIKNNADFNERLAVFIGAKGTELFYLKYEGADSPTLLQIKNENQDQLEFAKWISKEIRDLKEWYSKLDLNDRNEESRQMRLKQITERFQTDLQPRLKTELYKNFRNLNLNNARLGLYSTYVQDMDVFERAFGTCGNDLVRFIEKMKSLEKAENPMKALSEIECS